MVETSTDVLSWIRKRVTEAKPDVVRDVLHRAVEALMGAEADAMCGARHGERSPDRVNRRNGYRVRDWDTRVGTIPLAIPKQRKGSYFPGWLLERAVAPSGR